MSAAVTSLDDVKLVLITNASLLHRWNVLPGLEILDQNNGEIWAKLDAGSEAYYRQVARSAVPFKQILENLRDDGPGKAHRDPDAFHADQRHSRRR